VIIDQDYDEAYDVIHRALQQGALPSLKDVHVNLEFEAARASLTGGFLGVIKTLHVVVDRDSEPELAALGLVRQLPALTELHVKVDGYGNDPVQWPPFIPPSVKALRITTPVPHSLSALPGMLEASGARLERLEVIIQRASDDSESIGEGLVHLAQALRYCSPTLKSLLLVSSDFIPILAVRAGCRRNDEGGPNSRRVEHLRVQWADVLAGVSACRELQVLVLPDIEVEPLFPRGTAFARLTQLKMSDYRREHPPDAGVMGLWELMASGGLPALATLSVRPVGLWGGMDKVRSRVTPALEAVAGTLTHLHLGLHVGYEWGRAVGKLGRLKDLALGKFQDTAEIDGSACQAFAQGLADSGDGGPLPLLWRVILLSEVCGDIDLLASLLLPSVRVLDMRRIETYRTALFTAYALRQAEYKHTLALYTGGMIEGLMRALAPDITISDAFEVNNTGLLFERLSLDSVTVLHAVEYATVS
jgi:hypothetical protein